MKIQFRLLLLVGWLFVACQPIADTESEMQLNDSLLFETGISSSIFHTNAFYDKEHGERLIYFVDEATTKQIKVFKLDGKQIEDIPLDALSISDCKIHNLNFISLDTIVALCSYSNRLCFLNRKGEVWRRQSLDTILSTDSSNYLLTASRNFIMPSGELLFYNGWLSYVDDSLQRSSSTDYYKHTFYNIWRRPVLVKVKDYFSTHPKIQRGFNLFQHISPNDSVGLMFDSRCKYWIGNEQIFAISYFTDQIYELDAKKLEWKTTLEMNTLSPKVGSRITPIIAQTVDPNDRSIEQNRNQARIIFEIYFNEKLRHFYLLLLKELPSNQGEFNPNRPWVIAVYDSTMQKLAEKEFDPQEYKKVLIPSEKGFFIERHKPFEKYHEQQAVFHEFVY